MSEFIHIPELASMLGITDAAVRGHIQRRTDAIPPWIHRGRRVVWKRKAVEAWINAVGEDEIQARPVRPARSSAAGRRS